MIDYLKENFQWLGAIVIPIVVAIIGLIAVLLKKSSHKQKIGDIHGNGNKIVNGDVKK